MTTKNEKKAFDLFQFGYKDSIIAARAELSLDRVKELRQLYNLFKAKEQQTEEKVIERHKKLLKDKKKFISLEEI